MSGLEFTSRLISALAWPLAVVVILVVFHKPLSELLKRLTRLEYKGLIFQLNEQAKAALNLLSGMAKAGLVDQTVAEATPFAAMVVSWGRRSSSWPV
jgi:hypothetical protein